MQGTKDNSKEQYLVEKVLRGDTRSFEDIIKMSERLVTQIVVRMVMTVTDRKDIAQDIYMKVYRNLPGFQFRASLSTWIAQIAYNTCLHYLEKKKLLLFDDMESFFEEEENNLKSATRQFIGFDTIIESSETIKIVHEEAEKLPILYKTLIILFHQEELGYYEISQITQLPIGTVKNYLFRARKMLKENLLTRYNREEL